MSLKEQTKKKKEFLKSFKSKACNISESCIAAEINRATFYNWYEKDPKFKDEVEEVRESMLDFTESKLMENIVKNDTKAIIFKLKTHGKKRGDIERVEQQQEISGEQTIKISFKNI
jgi:hypothetical protein